MTSLVDILFPAQANLKAEGKCPSCAKVIVMGGAFRDQLSYREFEISGLCQDCQDSVFDECKD